MEIGSGITVVNMIGNTAGMIITPVVGIVRQQTGNFSATIYLLTAIIAVAAALVLALRQYAFGPHLSRPHGRRSSASGDHGGAD